MLWREALARPFVDTAKGVPDVEAAWQGARDIVAERIAEDADVRASLRDLALAEGRLAPPATRTRFFAITRTTRPTGKSRRAFMSDGKGMSSSAILQTMS